MIAMQYKIVLSDDYDMDLIRERVKKNGYKTDGFQDLLLKAYLIQEKKDTFRGQNEYAPLYIWKHQDGMNKFIFDGFYNNILQSFGWQTINIAVPLFCDLEKDIHKSQYVLEVKHTILPAKQMAPLSFSKPLDNCLGKILVYSPDNWNYVEFYFYERKPETSVDETLYQILHLSQER